MSVELDCDLSPDDRLYTGTIHGVESGALRPSHYAIAISHIYEYEGSDIYGYESQSVQLATEDARKLRDDLNDFLAEVDE